MTDRKIPRDRDNDYAPVPIKARQEFVREHTDSAIEHDGRSATTAVPGDPGHPTDAVRAWLDWVEVMNDQDA